MVTSNNSIKSKSKKKSDGGDLTSSPVYPFKVDVAGFPERKYIAGIYAISKWLYISIFISIILSSLILIRAFSKSNKPIFINWDSVNKKFVYTKTYYGKNPAITTEILDIYDYMEQNFLTNYINNRFSISASFAENYNKWCDCKEDKTKKIKIGFLNDDTKCYLCNFTSKEVFSAFIENDYTKYIDTSNSGIKRTVQILDMKRLHHNITFPKLDFVDKVLKLFVSGKYLKQMPKATATSIYKIVFIINDIKDNIVTDKESFIGYITVNGLYNEPEYQKIISENYMFHSIRADDLLSIYNRVI